MRRDPLRNFRFRLEIDGINEAHFSEVSGFDTTTDAIDYREGDDPTHVRKLPGLTKYGNVTLKRGITDSIDLYNWYKDVVAGKIRRVKVAIVVLDEEGKDKARFEITEAWPSKYDPMDLSAKGNDVAIETMELVNEGVVRTA
jgi:phage tail-like protein